MVQALQAYIISNNWENLMEVQGAIDLQPDWSTYSLANVWVQAYTSQGVSFLYNYGSTNGYPSVPPGAPTPVVPPPFAYSDWNSQQLYDVSWGIPSMLGVPQIFQRTQAKSWHAVARWGVDSDRSPIQFWGEASASSICPGDLCFDARQAWQVFFHELSADPQQGIAQAIDRATDIKCSNASTLSSCAP